MQSSKWKEKFNNLLAGVVLPVVAERPVNAFIIQNPDAVNIIYAGPENNTSATNYETYIAPGQWGVIARPFSFDSIFLFSAGAVNRVKIVEAIVDDPLALASRNIGGSSQEVFVTSTVGLTSAQLNIEAVTRNLNVKIPGSSVSVTATQTRPNVVEAYTALDVVGTDPAANMTFATGLTAGKGFVIYGARLRIDAAAIPAGMTSFRLHLYTSAPTAIADNAAFGLIAGDRAKYLGYVEISGVLGLGATLWAEVDNINFTGKLAEASSTLYGVLQTVGAYTPTASVVKTVSIIIAPL